MNRGERIIYYALNLAQLKFGREMQQKVWSLVEVFINNTEDIDLDTICKLEVLLNEELLMIPTKQQWRKIKLQKLNEIMKEK